MPTPLGGPSLVDLLARQLLALADQSKALRAGLDAFDSQVNAGLESVRAMQQMEAQRIAAAQMRTEERDAPKLPPVFGRTPAAVHVDNLSTTRTDGHPSIGDAPPIPPIPRDFPRASP